MTLFKRYTGKGSETTKQSNNLTRMRSLEGWGGGIYISVFFEHRIV